MCHATLCRTKCITAEAIVHGCLASARVIWLYPHAYGDGQNLRVFVVFCTHNPFLRLKVIFQLWRQRTLLLLPFGEPVSKVTQIVLPNLSRLGRMVWTSYV